MNNKRESTITLSKNEADMFNSLLSVEPNYNDDAVRMYGYHEDSTIYTVTAYFDDGFFADIKLCSGQSNFFGDAVLFSNRGCEICVLDCFDSISNDDTFKFECGNTIYIVHVKIKLP